MKYKYLLVGGGMSADAAARGIREIDPQGSIGLISDESSPPYNRPPLSKGLWRGQPLEEIFRGTESLGVELHLGHRVTSLDPGQNKVVDERGCEFDYEKLLLATGGAPRRLPFAPADDLVIYYRNLQDYFKLQEAVETSANRFAVIGGGFIGSEVAAALADSGCRVSMIFPETGIGARNFPADLSEFLNRYYRERGVEVLAGHSLEAIELREEETVVRTSKGSAVTVHGVVAGLGIRPNTELAEQAGLEVKDGIVVDEFCQSSVPGIYAAGDVARFFSPALNKMVRVEHEDNANLMGYLAGQNMAGAQEPYHHLPFFYSDLFDLGYEAVGEMNSGLETFSDWAEPYQKGVIYYLDKGRLQGIVLWNVWEKLELARELIGTTPANLPGLIPWD